MYNIFAYIATFNKLSKLLCHLSFTLLDSNELYFLHILSYVPNFCLLT